MLDNASTKKLFFPNIAFHIITTEAEGISMGIIKEVLNTWEILCCEASKTASKKEIRTTSGTAMPVNLNVFFNASL